MAGGGGMNSVPNPPSGRSPGGKALEQIIEGDQDCPELRCEFPHCGPHLFYAGGACGIVFARTHAADRGQERGAQHHFAIRQHLPRMAQQGTEFVLPGLDIHRLGGIVDSHQDGNDIRLEGEDIGIPAGGKAGEEIGKALSLATYNYMLGRGLDMPAKVWFKT